VPDWAPFAGAVIIYVLAFLGLAYSLFPYVVMDRIDIWQAAAHPSSLTAILFGALIVLPFIVVYTVYAYRVFRGKATGKLYE
jgi:cytochrome d ubiquinol oxidase subunit II